MKKYILLLVLTLISPGIASAGGMNDDPLLAWLLVDQFEIRNTDGDNPFVWDAEGWVGRDMHKLWIKTDGEIDRRSV